MYVLPIVQYIEPLSPASGNLSLLSLSSLFSTLVQYPAPDHTPEHRPALYPISKRGRPRSPPSTLPVTGLDL